MMVQEQTDKSIIHHSDSIATHITIIIIIYILHYGDHVVEYVAAYMSSGGTLLTVC
jgi:hypothetical protein